MHRRARQPACPHPVNIPLPPAHDAHHDADAALHRRGQPAGRKNPGTDTTDDSTIVPACPHPVSATDRAARHRAFQPMTHTMTPTQKKKPPRPASSENNLTLAVCFPAAGSTGRTVPIPRTENREQITGMERNGRRGSGQAGGKTPTPENGGERIKGSPCEGKTAVDAPRPRPTKTQKTDSLRIKKERNTRRPAPSDRVARAAGGEEGEDLSSPPPSANQQRTPRCPPHGTSRAENSPDAQAQETARPAPPRPAPKPQ
ncbi:hypothetical protein B0H12DRAFT_1222627 [Mycena haematopus]|nr:hypothetical protein B0H12DRAFT_1222627 [Mycena haematopus]